MNKPMHALNNDSGKSIRNQKLLSIEEISLAVNVSKRAVRKWREDGKIEERFIKQEVSPGGQGFRYLYDPMGIPEPHRSKYIREHLEANEDLLQQEMDAIAYAEAPGYAKEHANLWLNLIHQFSHLKGKELKGAITAWKESHPDAKVSVKSFYRNKKKYDEGGLTELLPNYGNRKGDSKIPKEYQDLFNSLYLKESKPTPMSCWRIVRGKAYKDGVDISDFATAKTFLYHLRKEVPKSTIYFYREGKEKWNRKYGYYVDRDKSDVAANDCWVGDHRLLDIFVINEETGNIFRPWCTAWMDFKTNKFMEVHTYEGYPDSDRIIQSLKWGVEEFGRPYKSIYIDNGKDYKSKDFAGGKKRLNEAETRTVVGMLGITAHFALPYNAQSKNIERAFRQFIEWAEKHLPGYAGNRAYNRPEDTKDRVKKGDLIPFKKFQKDFENFVYEVVNKTVSHGKELQGRAPDEAFYTEFSKKIAVRPEALRLMCMRTSNPVKVQRNGVHDSELKKKYWAEWMSGYKGVEVYLRRDIKAYQEAWVYHNETNECLGTAQLAETHDGFVTTDIDREKLKEAQKIKRKEQRLHKKYLEFSAQLSPDEIFEALQNNVKAQDELRGLDDDFYEVHSKVDVIQMDTTKMDEDIKNVESRENNGPDDLGDFLPQKNANPKKLKEIWDEDIENEPKRRASNA